ncbi:MAG: hypothetical protein ACE5OZ_06285 [Candidatus Heimdallarchaeota archaeon]
MKTLSFKKLKKQVKKTVPWIEPLADSGPEVILDIRPNGNVRFMESRDNRCAVCKGNRLLCGKTRCPVVARVHSFQKTTGSLASSHLSGSSPPSVFVGRIGYPHVYVGPMVPSYHGDTTVLDQTESWFDYDLPKILDFRSSLVRGMFRAKVTDLRKSNKILAQTRELTLSHKSADAEMGLKRPPRLKLEVDADVQPMGPSGPISKLSVDVGKTDHQIEKAFYDGDLLAQDAVIDLYKSGRVYQSSITRAFSVGMFGQEKKRRLVPTRWSITAVDSLLGLHYRDTLVRQAPWISEFRVFEGNHFPEITKNPDGTHSAKVGNRFIILMMPGSWSYEAIEAFFPGASWNPHGASIGMCSDWEPYQGRTRYARIGGCYYTARLRIAEYLANEGKQAMVIVMREEYPTMTMPVGVWLVRETVRRALETSYRKFETLKDALAHVATRFKIPLETWIHTSDILQREKKIGHQSSLEQWF